MLQAVDCLHKRVWRRRSPASRPQCWPARVVLPVCPKAAALLLSLCPPLPAGKLFLVHTKLDGVITFRFAIGATNTQPHHIREAWAVMQQQLDAAPKN